MRSTGSGSSNSRATTVGCWCLCYRKCDTTKRIRITFQIRSPCTFKVAYWMASHFASRIRSLDVSTSLLFHFYFTFTSLFRIRAQSWSLLEEHPYSIPPRMYTWCSSVCAKWILWQRENGQVHVRTEKVSEWYKIDQI